MKSADELDQFAYQILDAINRMDAAISRTSAVQDRCESIEQACTSDQVNAYPAVF